MVKPSLIVVAVVLAGCLSTVTNQNYPYACADGVCPPGASCIAGVCVAGDGGSVADGGDGGQSAVDGGDAGGGVGDAGACPFAQVFASSSNTVRCLPAVNTTGECNGIAVADVNNDGLGDLIVGDSNDGTVNVLLSTGGGEFSTNPTLIPLNNRGACSDVSSPASVAAVALPGQVAVLGSFPDSNQVGVAVVDADAGGGELGLLQLMSTGGLCTSGEPSFDQPPIAIGHGANGPFSVILDSVQSDNGVNQIDVMGIGSTGQLSAFLPLVLTKTPISYVAADVNGDGLDDILVAEDDSDGETGNLQIFVSLADAGFAAPLTLTAGVGAGAVAAVTVGGMTEILVGNYFDNSVSVFHGDGGPLSFQHQSKFPVGVLTDPIGLVLGDFDRDGVIDVAVLGDSLSVDGGDTLPSPIVLVQGLPDGGFASDAEVTLTATNLYAAWILSANLAFDGGAPDLAVSYSIYGDGSSEVDVFQNQCH